MKDNLGRFEIVSEVDFGKVTIQWIDYMTTNSRLRPLGGAYVTQALDSQTGEVILRRYARNPRVRDNMLNTTIAQAEKILSNRGVV
mgnify:CR=1 FL=1